MKYWELLKHLTSRDIKARYKQSLLGILWVILNPLFQMIILSFVFSYVIKFPFDGISYPIFIFTGLLPWIFFSQALGAATESLVSNASLLKKVYFPREILVISAISAKAFDFFVSFGLFMLFMIFYNIKFDIVFLLVIPIFILHLIFTYALSLLLAVANLYYRDIKYLLALVLQLWFYLTPIIYATDFFPGHLRWIFVLNPLAYFIESYRSILLFQQVPSFTTYGILCIVLILLLGIANTIFRKLSGTFADVA